jgi:hypothetical protein
MICSHHCRPGRACRTPPWWGCHADMNGSITRVGWCSHAGRNAALPLGCLRFVMTACCLCLVTMTHVAPADYVASCPADAYQVAEGAQCRYVRPAERLCSGAGGLQSLLMMCGLSCWFGSRVCSSASTVVWMHVQVSDAVVGCYNA